eukprot:TRINITY_DN33211_c0_g1_i1.p1 TRINITY_DN33211_c0_g1~~TRINITY_DN33211_c0_g1_i1.p1  ORF type:complete len:420 (+),score=62.70 TRINITY_DN33211_c0_g1_i1:193-1452(+)
MLVSSRPTQALAIVVLFWFNFSINMTLGVNMGTRRARNLHAAKAKFTFWSPTSAEAAAEDRPPGFVIMSSPTTSNIYFAEMPSFGELSKPLSERTSLPQAHVLIDGTASRCMGTNCSDDSDEGLRRPEGLALHQGREGVTLYVSDVDAKNIYAYELAGGAQGQMSAGQGPGAGLRVGKQRRVREGVDNARWLAVDGAGNLFYTVEAGQVETVSAEHIRTGNTTWSILYDAAEYPTVSAPAGIAADGSRIYWANTAGGGDAGTIATGAQRPTASTGDGPMAIAANGVGAVGVCLAKGRLFYTGGAASLFTVAPSGGAIGEVYDGFQKPLACAYDGENTLYVTDADSNAVFSLPAVTNFRAVRNVSKVATVDDPFGVVVFTAVGGNLQGAPLDMYNSCPRTASSAGAVAAAAIAVWIAMAF